MITTIEVQSGATPTHATRIDRMAPKLATLDQIAPPFADAPSEPRRKDAITA